MKPSLRSVGRIALGMSVFAVTACGSPPPSTPPAAPAAPAAQAPSGAPAVEAKPTGAVTFQQVLDEQKARLKLLFSNPTKRSCRLDGYTVTWGGNRHKTVTLKDLVIPPGETRDRWIKLDGDEIDAARAPMDSLTVSLNVECS